MREAVRAVVCDSIGALCCVDDDLGRYLEDRMAGSIDAAASAATDILQRGFADALDGASDRRIEPLMESCARAQLGFE